MLAGSVGAGGILLSDPVLGSGPLSAVRYGHGRDLAAGVLYLGFVLLVWAWVRLGRGVLNGLVGSRGVLLAATAWIAPMVLAPPLFTRDVYSYLGQGLLALQDLDPYLDGPSVLSGPIPDNVHWFWQTTPAPYGPLFIAIAKAVVLVAGSNVLASVIAMRLVLLGGLALFVFVLPGLVQRLGGQLPLALWLAVASPLTVVHLVGGPHNDMLVVGLVAAGGLLTLEGRHVAGITLVTLGMAVKATAGVALPFLVWVWAARLRGALWQRFVRALAASLAVFTAVFGSCMLLAKVGFGWLPALSAPSRIVNYLSLPTGLGQLAHQVVSLFVDVDATPFVKTGRTVGALALVAFLAWQWWLAREGGPDALRRAGVALLVTAILSPTTLPWYFSWGVALLAAVPWNRRMLALFVAASVAVTLVYYPDGEEAMNNWAAMLVVVAGAVLAGLSLLRFDPLGLGDMFLRWAPNTPAGAADDKSVSQRGQPGS